MRLGGHSIMRTTTCHHVYVRRCRRHRHHTNIIARSSHINITASSTSSTPHISITARVTYTLRGGTPPAEVPRIGAYPLTP